MTKQIIAVVCPTVRPAAMIFMAESAQNHATNPMIVAALDKDESKRNLFGTNHAVFTATGNGIVRVLNEAVKHVLDAGYDWVLFVGDDCRFMTDGWDEKLLAAVPEDGIGVVYPAHWPGKDGAENECFAYHFMLSRKWLETVGYMAYPGFDGLHYGLDTWVIKVGRELKRMFPVKDVLVQHFHYQRGGVLDEVYKRNEANANKAGRVYYGKECQDEIKRMVEKLRGEMK